MKKIFLILLLGIFLTGCQRFKGAEKEEIDMTVVPEKLMSTVEESQAATHPPVIPPEPTIEEIEAQKAEREKRKSREEIAEERAKEYVYYKEVEQGANKEIVTAAFLKELPDSKVIAGREFDECGDEEKYKEYAWYDSLKTNLHETAQKSEYINLSFYKHSIPFSPSSISEMCLSSDGKFVIGLYGVDYCNLGLVFRYDTEEDLVEVAKLLDDYRIGCHTGLRKFWKSNGVVIPISAIDGDGGCRFTASYDYNFTTNTLKKRWSCSKCGPYDDNGDGEVNELDEPGTEKCTEY